MKDTNHIKGIFRLFVWSESGELLETYEDHNLVVNGGRTATVRLLGGDVTNRSVTQLAVGTNSTAPSATDTAITGAFTKALGTVSYPTVSSVQFDWSLELAEANGIAIVEFGLLCANGTLFARKTRAVINKNNTIRLSGNWTLQF